MLVSAHACRWCSFGCQSSGRGFGVARFRGAVPVRESPSLDSPRRGEFLISFFSTFLWFVSLGVSQPVSFGVSFGVSPHNASRRGPTRYVFPSRVVRCFVSVPERVSSELRKRATVAVDFHPQRSIRNRTDKGRVSRTPSCSCTPCSSKSLFANEANPHRSTAARNRQYSVLSHSSGSVKREAEIARKRATLYR